MDNFINTKIKYYFYLRTIILTFGLNPNKYDKMSWKEHYKDRVNDDGYLQYFKEKYKPFLDEIRENMPPYILGVGEFGCGIGSTTKAIEADFPHTHYLYDNNQEMLDLATENLYFNRYRFPTQLWDITKPFPQPRAYDLIHSHGVIEHFSDIEIYNIIRFMRNYTPTQVHYVPSIGYDEPSYGDERLMSKEKWLDILCMFDVEAKYFNGNKDLTLIIRR